MSSPLVPRKQRAAVKHGKGTDTKIIISEVDVTLPGPGQILVKINWTGVCGSDKSALLDERAWFGHGLHLSTRGIGGHEAAGVVVAIGKGAELHWKINDRAGIKWITSICGQCEFCLRGEDALCPEQENSGRSVPGTFQEYCLVDARYATRIPDGVKDEDAAPIMCGGLVAYSACKKSALNPGEWIAIFGAGGGVGHFAVQYSIVKNLRVIAIDTGDAKKELATQLGAERFIDFRETPDVAAEVFKITGSGAHGVIVATPAAEAYAKALPALRPGGVLVCVGLATDPTVLVGIHPLILVMKKLRIVGVCVGNLNDAEECLHLTAQGLVRPITQKGKLEDLRDCLDLIDHGQVVGKLVLSLA